MSSTVVDDIVSLRDQIAEFSAVRCRLYHEAARYDPSLPFPIVPPAPDAPYSTPIFCPIGQRRGRIGCAHTMSRAVMQHAIRMLDPGEREALLEELSRIDGTIGMLDHAMSETAKETERIRNEMEERRLRGEEIERELEETYTALRTRIREITARHDGCIDEIDRFRWTLVARLDAVAAP